MTTLVQSERVTAYDFAETLAIDWPCPESACCAQPGEPCVVIDGRGRRRRKDFHILRRGLAVDWMDAKPGAAPPVIIDRGPPQGATADVYALRDPVTDEVRYIGRSIDAHTRALQHVGAAGRAPQSDKDHWIAGLIAAGLEPRVEVLETVPLQAADAAENRWIAHAVAVGWPITNIRKPKTRRAKAE